jgi:hypothetical protein
MGLASEVPATAAQAIKQTNRHGIDLTSSPCNRLMDRPPVKAAKPAATTMHKAAPVNRRERA